MALGYDFAPRNTPVAAGQTDSEIAGGGTIYVHGILCSASGGAATVTLERADNTHIQTIEIPTGTTFESTTKWLADGGLQITTSANATCVVFHSQPGA